LWRLGCGGGCCCGRDGRALFCAEECYELGDLVVAEGVGEGRHLLAAVQDLIGHFFRRPVFIFADFVERWGFFCALEVGSVTVGAALVAKERGAGFFLVRCGRWSGHGGDRSGEHAE
jgi:hypothetical protein